MASPVQISASVSNNEPPKLPADAKSFLMALGKAWGESPSVSSAKAEGMKAGGERGQRPAVKGGGREVCPKGERRGKARTEGDVTQSIGLRPLVAPLIETEAPPQGSSDKPSGAKTNSGERAIAKRSGLNVEARAGASDVFSNGATEAFPSKNDRNLQTAIRGTKAEEASALTSLSSGDVKDGVMESGVGGETVAEAGADPATRGMQRLEPASLDENGELLKVLPQGWRNNVAFVVTKTIDTDGGISGGNDLEPTEGAGTSGSCVYGKAEIDPVQAWRAVIEAGQAELGVSGERPGVETAPAHSSAGVKGGFVEGPTISPESSVREGVRVTEQPVQKSQSEPSERDRVVKDSEEVQKTKANGPAENRKIEREIEQAEAPGRTGEKIYDEPSISEFATGTGHSEQIPNPGLQQRRSDQVVRGIESQGENSNQMRPRIAQSDVGRDELDGAPISTEKENSTGVRGKVRREVERDDEVSITHTESTHLADGKTERVERENPTAQIPHSRTAEAQTEIANTGGGELRSVPDQDARGIEGVSREPVGRSAGEAEYAAQPTNAPTQSARLIELANRSEMHVGIHTPETGRLEVHTFLRDGQADAVIAIEKSDVRSAVLAELPNLQASLREHHVDVSHVAVMDAGNQSFGDSSGGGGHGAHQQSGRESRNIPELQSPVSVSLREDEEYKHRIHVGLSVHA